MANSITIIPGRKYRFKGKDYILIESKGTHFFIAPVENRRDVKMIKAVVFAEAELLEE